MPSAQWRAENQDKARKYRTDYYQRNREREIARAQQNRDDYRQRNVDEMRKEKSKPCADCGTEYPYYVMHFDHLGEHDKEGEVSRMANRPVSLARLRAEMAKCEVVCANCHAIRTWERAYGGEAKLNSSTA